MYLNSLWPSGGESEGVRERRSQKQLLLLSGSEGCTEGLPRLCAGSCWCPSPTHLPELWFRSLVYDMCSQAERRVPEARRPKVHVHLTCPRSMFPDKCLPLLQGSASRASAEKLSLTPLGRFSSTSYTPTALCERPQYSKAQWDCNCFFLVESIATLGQGLCCFCLAIKLSTLPR